MLKSRNEPLRLTAQPKGTCSNCGRCRCKCDREPSMAETRIMRTDAYIKRMRAVTDRGGVWGAIHPYGEYF